MVDSTTAIVPSTWRRAVRLWRRHWQWAAMAGIAVAAIGFGYAGLSEYFRAAGQPRSFWDICYFILYLFVVESGEVSGPVPWPLTVARFLAPVVPAWAIVKAAAAIFHDRLQTARLRRTSGHVVICGLGRKGLRLVEDFHCAGKTVVVIESDEQNDAIRVCRELGVPVLLGNAAEKTLLGKAGAQRAEHVVALSGDDGTNVEIAVHTYYLVRQQGAGYVGMVRCFVHVVDLTLCNFFRQHPICAETTDPFDVKVFNTYENGARLLLEKHPLDRVRIAADDPRTVHLAIVGFGQMGQSVALQAARTGHYANGKKLRITAIDVEADARQKSLAGRYPRFEEVCDVQFIRGEVDDPEVLNRIREAARDRLAVTTVAICLDGDSRCLSGGLSVLSKLGEDAVPICVRMADESGLGALLRGDGSGSGWTTAIRPFGMTGLTCTRKILLDEDLDTLARAIHDDYRKKEAERIAPGAPLTVPPWQQLAPDLQDSNRQQADHIPVKLRAIGCYRSSTPAAQEPVIKFADEEVELLARMEHARFVTERILGGWTCGPKDVAKKTSPYLVDWDELSERIKDYDRDAVRNIPHLLKMIGQTIYRQQDGST